MIFWLVVMWTPSSVPGGCCCSVPLLWYSQWLLICCYAVNHVFWVISRALLGMLYCSVVAFVLHYCWFLTISRVVVRQIPGGVPGDCCYAANMLVLRMLLSGCYCHLGSCLIDWCALTPVYCCYSGFLQIAVQLINCSGLQSIPDF